MPINQKWLEQLVYRSTERRIKSSLKAANVVKVALIQVVGILLMSDAIIHSQLAKQMLSCDSQYIKWISAMHKKNYKYQNL